MKFCQVSYMCQKNVRVARFTFVTLQYYKTSQNFIRKLRKFNYKNICSTRYSDNTVLVLSKDTSAPTVIENPE